MSLDITSYGNVCELGDSRVVSHPNDQVKHIITNLNFI